MIKGALFMGLSFLFTFGRALKPVSSYHAIGSPHGFGLVRNLGISLCGRGVALSSNLGGIARLLSRACNMARLKYHNFAKSLH
jgi:hypothetical protein